jgi:hypothetical protein
MEHLNEDGRFRVIIWVLVVLEGDDMKMQEIGAVVIEVAGGMVGNSDQL